MLGATLDELARVGYGALSIDGVATRAGVNKTTVYRRWPTKAHLVRSALTAMAETAPRFEETGDIRSDLLALARRMSMVTSSPHGRSIARMILGGCAEGELVSLALSLRRRLETPTRRLLERAIAGGQLRSSVDLDLLFETLRGWIIHRLFRERVPVTDERLRRLVDLLLRGALAEKSADRRTSRRRDAPAQGA